MNNTQTQRFPEVKNLMAGLITLDLSKRVMTLDAVMRVYQGTYPFVRASLDSGLESKIERANKAAALAIGGSTLEEKETAYMSAIRIYERVYGTLRGWAGAAGLLDATLVELNSKREELIRAKIWAQEEQERLNVEFAGLLTFLNKVFAQFGVTFRVVFEQEQGRLFSAAREITFGRAYLDELRTMDVLAVAFREAYTVAKAISVVRDGDGRNVLDNNRIAGAFPVILTALHAAVVAGGISVKVEVERVTKPSVKATGTRSWAHVPTTGKGGGLFRPGSYLAMLYDRVSTCRGITFTELFNGIPAKDPERMFQTVAERGLAANKFTLTKDGNGNVLYKAISK